MSFLGVARGAGCERLYLQGPTSRGQSWTRGSWRSTEPEAGRMSWASVAATCGSAFKLIKVHCSHCPVSMLLTLSYWASIFSLLKLPRGPTIASQRRWRKQTGSFSCRLSPLPTGSNSRKQQSRPLLQLRFQFRGYFEKPFPPGQGAGTEGSPSQQPRVPSQRRCH